MKRSQVSGVLLLSSMIIQLKVVQSFTGICSSSVHRQNYHACLRQTFQNVGGPLLQRTARRSLASTNPNNDDDTDDEGNDVPADTDNATNQEQGDDDFHRQLQSRHETLEVEKTRTALEEQHTQSFLKRRPRKLPYEDARKWVQANLGASTKEEYDDLVANGNLRTPYIPKQPEEYYTSTREWISWDHFLKGVFDDERPSEIRPRTGIFD